MTPPNATTTEREDGTTPIRRAIGEVLMAAAHHKIASPECAQAVERLVELHTAALLAARRENETLRAKLAPCGECHIQPGETCDICGKVQHE